MKRVVFFCIPAHGHTNPMLPVAAELVRRGNTVRFYSFNAFEEKIRAAGAEYVSCDAYLPGLTEQQMAGLMRVSTTEMTIQAIRTTINMDSFLQKEFEEFCPDVVYTDSACFWGKLNAMKHHVPMVVSTSTFAFNQLSSGYMKYSVRELADMILGLPRISRELSQLEPYGYHVKSALSLVQSDNDTDSVVYTSRQFQPYAKSFSDHYLFVGPSVFSAKLPAKDKERPLVYISMGTVINDRPDFYKKCLRALENLNVDVVLSYGNSIDMDAMGPVPGNIRIYQSVNQLEVLSKADVFITHCGMNSVSESLYMAAPMVFYPQTGEQKAVARRAEEMGAGVLLKDDSVDGIRTAVLQILNQPSYGKAAASCSEDFRSCSGPAGAAEFIENAPHTSNGVDVIRELNKANARFQRIRWFIAVVILLTGVITGWKYVWVTGILISALSYPLGQLFRKRTYTRLTEGQSVSRADTVNTEKS